MKNGSNHSGDDMRRLTVSLLLALLAFSFGCISAFFWYAYHPPCPACDYSYDGLPTYTLTFAIISLFISVPGLIYWLDQHPGKQIEGPQDAEEDDNL
jgi:hypothetical protein